MSDWRKRVILNPGESLKIDDSRSKGFMQETDIYDCSIVNADGIIVGKVTASDHTAVRGFRRTLSVKQTDSAGRIVLDATWTA